MPYGLINDIPVLFIHIPKSAGTSVKRHFNLQMQGHETLGDFIYTMNQGRIYTAANGDQATSEEVFDQWLAEIEHSFRALREKSKREKVHPIKNVFKFSFVRNPWDRASSIYHYHKKDFGGLGQFEKFVTSMNTRTGPIYSPDSTTDLSLTQTQYLSVGSNCLPLRTYDIEPENFLGERGIHPTPGPGNTSQLFMDYIGRFETLHEDVGNICRILEDVSRSSTPHPSTFTHHERKSENVKQSYKEAYESFHSIYTVFKYYIDDVKNFNYTFSGEPDCDVTQQCFERYNRLAS